MAREALASEHLCSGARVQETLVGGPEETLVGVEPGLEQLTEELAENPSAVDSGLVQAMSVQQVHPDTLLQIRL